MKAKYAGILSAVLGSICCVGPLLLIALGLGTSAAIIGRYHWIFVGAAIVVLVWAWTKHFREKAQCACEHRAMYGRRISLLTLIVASVIVVAFAALNISSYAFPGSPAPVSATIQVARNNAASAHPLRPLLPSRPPSTPDHHRALQVS